MSLFFGQVGGGAVRPQPDDLMVGEDDSGRFAALWDRRSRGGVALSTALRLSACGGPLPGALPKRGLIKTGLGRIQETKKSSFEVDVGTTWSGPGGPGHTAHSYFVLISIWW